MGTLAEEEWGRRNEQEKKGIRYEWEKYPSYKESYIQQNAAVLKR